MRMSRLLVRTLREAPADADSPGHALLVRAGFVRRLSSGIYSFLPLGLRVLHKISAVVREEQDKEGMQEVLLPVLSPYELWEESGRAKIFGSDLLPAMTTEGRGGTFVLGPTHEEVVTKLVAGEVDSYRQLPITVYQIQTKFRDEPRPRTGLLRTRELTMCDAYSFDVDKDAMAATYETVKRAYQAIFDRLQIGVIPVEASSGAIGGDVNHEWMVPAEVGEDHFALCESCGLSANIEAAKRSINTPAVNHANIDAPAPSPVDTPDSPSIEAVVALLASEGVTAERIMKSIATFDRDGQVTIILVPGDREARLPHGWRLFEDADFAAHPHLVRGYIGPVGLSGVTIVADESLRHAAHSFVSGANQVDVHLRDIVIGRDVTPSGWGSYVVVQDGDSCPNCGAAMVLQRSVEAAHTFQLGLHYTTKLSNTTFVGEDGTEQPFWMGCYGFGVSRAMAVMAELNRDEHGLIWPAEVAPYRVSLLSLGASKNETVGEVADAAYRALKLAGIDVLYDDRDVSAGVKFADADLIGAPLRITLGSKGLDREMAEVRDRRTGEVRELSLGRLLSGKVE